MWAWCSHRPYNNICCISLISMWTCMLWACLGYRAHMEIRRQLLRDASHLPFCWGRALYFSSCMAHSRLAGFMLIPLSLPFISPEECWDWRYVPQHLSVCSGSQDWTQVLRLAKQHFHVLSLRPNWVSYRKHIVVSSESKELNQKVILLVCFLLLWQMPWPKAPWGRKSSFGVLMCSNRGESFREGKAETQARIWRWELKRGPWRNAVHWFVV